MIRSSASVTPSTSAAAALRNHCSASSPSAERQQRLGVGVKQAGGGLPGARRIQLRRRQNRQRLIELSQIRPGAGHHDAQFVGVVAGELGGFGTAGQFDGPFGAADARVRSRR